MGVASVWQPISCKSVPVLGDRLWLLTLYILPQLGLQRNYDIQKVFYWFVRFGWNVFPSIWTVPVLVSSAVSLLLLLFSHHAFIQTRAGRDRYLLNEGSLPPSLMNAAYGCPRAASVSDFRDCLYNLSHLLFLLGHRAAEPDSDRKGIDSITLHDEVTVKATQNGPQCLWVSFASFNMKCALHLENTVNRSQCVSAAAVGKCQQNFCFILFASV